MSLIFTCCLGEGCVASGGRWFRDPKDWAIQPNFAWEVALAIWE